MALSAPNDPVLTSNDPGWSTWEATAISAMVQVEDKARLLGRMIHTNGPLDLAVIGIIARLGSKWGKSGLGWAADGGLARAK